MAPQETTGMRLFGVNLLQLVKLYNRRARAPLNNPAQQHLYTHNSTLHVVTSTQRFQLARFDDDADGYLTPDQLLEYVADTASQITQITQFTQQLSLGEYSDLALRKLLFWHHRGGR